MYDTDDPDEVIAKAGGFTTAVTSMTGHIGGVTDDMIVHTKPRSALDRALVQKLAWVQETFQNAVRETDGQARKTRDATVVGTTMTRNADIDGSVVVRSAEA